MCTMWLFYNCVAHIAEERPRKFEHHPRLGLDHGIEGMFSERYFYKNRH